MYCVITTWVHGRILIKFLFAYTICSLGLSYLPAGYSKFHRFFVTHTQQLPYRIVHPFQLCLDIIFVVPNSNTLPRWV